MQTSPRRGIQYPDQGPTRDDAPDIPLHIKDLIIGFLDSDTPWSSGTEAAKPAAGGTLIGTWYWATDSSILYINTGTWTPIAFLASPAFTGTPTAPTQPVTDKSTRLATTAFVRSLLPAGIGPLPWSGSTAPAGWLLCDGSAVSRTTYADLFAEIGTTYGAGDGSTTFNLPNTAGRVMAGKAAAGTFATLGAVGGEETHLLTSAEMPAHDHGSTSSVSAGTPAGTISSDSAGTPSGTLNSVSAGTPAGSVSVGGSGTLTTGGESVSHTHGYMEATSAAYVASGGATDHGYGQGVDLTSGVATSIDSRDHTHTIASHGHTATFTGSALAGHAHSFTGAAMAAHSHTFTGTALAAHSHTTASAGGGGAHNNLQPYLVTNYIIKF